MQKQHQGKIWRSLAIVFRLLTLVKIGLTSGCWSFTVEHDGHVRRGDQLGDKVGHLRILEAKGLIEIRVGAAAGAFVRAPNFEPLSDSLTTMLKLQKTDILELAEARKVVETAIAELAAQRATPEDLEAMEEALAEAKETLTAWDPHYMPHSVAFHIALARGAKNQVLLFTVDSFRSLFYQALERLPSSEMAHRAVADHHQIYEAVKNRDPQKARQFMEEHLNYFEERVRAMSETSNRG